MNNLASFTLCMLMAYTVNAQLPVNWPNYTPFLSSPYHYYNHQVLSTKQNAPVLQQNADQHVLHRDAMVSLMLRELKETSKRLAETNTVVENMKNEMTELKNELAQLKKSAEEKDKAESLKNESNETKTQTEMLTTEFEPFTFNSSNDRETPTARFCSCNMVVYIIDRLTKELDDTKFQLESLTTQFKVSISPTTINKEPTSCADLKQLGYQKSGVFSVKGNKRVQSVYCDFTKTDVTGLQTLIGTVNVKSISVSFHAQRSTSFSTLNAVIPFDLLKSNVGNAMSTDGVFTAPIAGTYFFAFSGVSVQAKQARVELRKQTTTLATAYASDGPYETLSFQVIVPLFKGEEIRLYLTVGEINEAETLQYNNYVGFLLEEELI